MNANTVSVADNGDDTHTIECTCGERVTYAGKAFTQVEAQRHARWHNGQANVTTPFTVGLVSVTA